MLVWKKQAELAAANAAAGGGILGMVLGAVAMAIPTLMGVEKMKARLSVARAENEAKDDFAKDVMKRNAELARYDVRDLSVRELSQALAKRMVEEEERAKREARIDEYERQIRNIKLTRKNGESDVDELDSRI